MLRQGFAASLTVLGRPSTAAACSEALAGGSKVMIISGEQHSALRRQCRRRCRRQRLCTPETDRPATLTAHYPTLDISRRYSCWSGHAVQQHVRCTSPQQQRRGPTPPVRSSRCRRRRQRFARRRPAQLRPSRRRAAASRMRQMRCTMRCPSRRSSWSMPHRWAGGCLLPCWVPAAVLDAAVTDVICGCRVMPETPTCVSH